MILHVNTVSKNWIFEMKKHNLWYKNVTLREYLCILLYVSRVWRAERVRDQILKSREKVKKDKIRFWKAHTRIVHYKCIWKRSRKGRCYVSENGHSCHGGCRILKKQLFLVKLYHVFYQCTLTKSTFRVKSFTHFFSSKFTYQCLNRVLISFTEIFY